jgi:hypothetical protein
MFAVFSTMTGYTDEYIVAVFTTKEKAEIISAKIKERFPQEHFYVGEYVPPKVDPTFEEILEGISDERTDNES